MRREPSTVIGILLALAGLARAQDQFAAPGYAAGAAAYLAMPAHAYGAGLSGAATAWGPGLAGLQYNPAILDDADRWNLIGSFSFLSDDRQFQAVDGVAPIGDFAVAGISFVNAGAANLERRDPYGALDPNSPYFSDQENSVALAAAGRLPWNLALGGRVRYLYQRLDKTSANGFGLDAGATWAPDPHVCVGASVLNVGSRLWWETGHADDVLTEGRLGVAGFLLKRHLVAELDVIKTWTQPEDLAFGLQYTLFDIISLRGGLTSSIDTKTGQRRDPDYSLGLGIRYSFFGCDYAVTIPTGETDLISHRISLVLAFANPFLQ